jgi:hypothetical protein
MVLLLQLLEEPEELAWPTVALHVAASTPKQFSDISIYYSETGTQLQDTTSLTR